jgi:hypothetical protein
MTTRNLCVRLAFPPALALALLLAATLLSTGADKSVRLGADVLDRSRGGILTNVLTQSSCNALNGNFACTKANTACAVCSVTTYTNVAQGQRGGYQAGEGGGYCGINSTGTCNASLTCVAGAPVGNCATPPVVWTESP